MKSIFDRWRCIFPHKTSLIWPVAFVFLVASSTRSQSHFPLGSGNTWLYYAQWDSTSVLYRTIVGDTTMPNGKTYAIMSYGYSSLPNPYGSMFYREDSDKVYAYIAVFSGGTSYLEDVAVYDFSKKFGDTVRVTDGDTIRLCRVHTDSVLGMIKKTYRFCDYSWYSETIADSFGLVQLTGDAYEQDICGARINGISYGLLTSVNELRPQRPGGYLLKQNYPNPFNPTSTIHFEIPKESHVTLKLYNVLGQEFMTVVDERRIAGVYDAAVDGSKLPSGIYFYRLEATSITDPTKVFTQARKMVLMK